MLVARRLKGIWNYFKTLKVESVSDLWHLRACVRGWQRTWIGGYKYQLYIDDITTKEKRKVKIMSPFCTKRHKAFTDLE